MTKRAGSLERATALPAAPLTRPSKHNSVYQTELRDVQSHARLTLCPLPRRPPALSHLHDPHGLTLMPLPPGSLEINLQRRFLTASRESLLSWLSGLAQCSALTFQGTYPPCRVVVCKLIQCSVQIPGTSAEHLVQESGWPWDLGGWSCASASRFT